MSKLSCKVTEIQILARIFIVKRIAMKQLSENNGNKMKCIECGGHMRLRQISGYMQTKTVVDAFVCDNCGEIVFPSASAKILEQALDCKSKM